LKERPDRGGRTKYGGRRDSHRARKTTKREDSKESSQPKNYFGQLNKRGKRQRGKKKEEAISV